MHKVVITLIFCSLFSLTLFAAAAPKEPVVITAPARFTQSDKVVMLLVADSKNKYELPWAYPPYDNGLVQLETNRVYTFAIIKEVRKKILDTTFFEPHISKIEQDGKIIYDHEVCEVHRARMQLQQVPIIYGRFAEDPNDPLGIKARQLFPHDSEYLLGGWNVEPDSPKTGKTYVCKQCQDAFAKWEKEHPTKKK